MFLYTADGLDLGNIFILQTLLNMLSPAYLALSLDDEELKSYLFF